MAHDKISSSLTAQLYSADDRAIRDATQHAFLEHAGKGTLPASTLCTWLVQDKYYQLAYVNFIGGLLAKLPLASCAFPHSDADNLTWKTLDVLISALTNIRREIEFYDETVGKYNLQADEAPPNDTTSQYIKLFEDASAKDAPMIHGLVVLWATEQVCMTVSTTDRSQTNLAVRHSATLMHGHMHHHRRRTRITSSHR
jgi:thiaminase